MAYYKDLREFLDSLDKAGNLIRIERLINKDTEIHPLVRLQFRGLPEEKRKAFLFENITDSKGRTYKGSVATCAAAPSTAIYAMGLKCQPAEIPERWAQARQNPIPPRLLKGGPAQEEIHTGATLLDHGGLFEFPHTISTPGYDASPYFTAPCWITKDPESGEINVGTYRGQVKSPTRTGIMFARPTQHMAQHWIKCRKLGRPLEAALVQGVTPHINYVSVAKLGPGESEFAVAGGLGGEPIELIKCKTVDLEVPAYAEIVVEGEVSISETEPEGPFGETLGYMGNSCLEGCLFNVKCITHRKNPIVQAFFSEFPPSESTLIKGIVRESSLYKMLRYDFGMSHVLSVAIDNDTSATGFFVIAVKHGTDQEKVWETLEKAHEALLRDPVMVTKMIIAVNDDIDPHDPGAVNWAVSFRMQPHRDTRLRTHLAESFADWGILDPSIVPVREAVTESEKYKDHPPEQSMLLVNATMKWDYPPLSLPKKEFMKNALQLWQELNLPTLRLREPWWGYKYGFWTDDEDRLAALATDGNYEEVGEILAKKREKIDDKRSKGRK